MNMDEELETSFFGAIKEFWVLLEEITGTSYPDPFTIEYPIPTIDKIPEEFKERVNHLQLHSRWLLQQHPLLNVEKLEQELNDINAIISNKDHTNKDKEILLRNSIKIVLDFQKRGSNVTIFEVAKSLELMTDPRYMI